MIQNNYTNLFFTDSVVKHWKILDKSNGKVLFADSNMIDGSEGVRLTESLYNEQNISFGSYVPSCIEFTIHTYSKSLVGKTIEVYLKLGNTWATATEEYMQIGVYKITDDVMNTERTARSIRAYDELYFLEQFDEVELGKWYNNLNLKNHPITLAEFRKKFLKIFGIKELSSSPNLVNDDLVIRHTIETDSLSASYVLKCICELNGVFPHINRKGYLEYITLQGMSEGTYPADDLYPKTSGLYPGIDSVQWLIERNQFSNSDYKDYICKNIRKLKIRNDSDDTGVTSGKIGKGWLKYNSLVINFSGDHNPTDEEGRRAQEGETYLNTIEGLVFQWTPGPITPQGERLYFWDLRKEYIPHQGDLVPSEAVISPQLNELYWQYEEDPVTHMKYSVQTWIFDGYDGSTYIIEDNFLVYGSDTDTLKAVADDLLEVIEQVYFRPSDITMMGNPCIEVGDSIRLSSSKVIIYTYVMNRELSGIMNLFDRITSDGDERIPNESQSASSEIKQLKRKTNSFISTLEETKREIMDLDKGAYSSISQTADQIKTVVSKSSDIWEKGDLTIRFNGYGNPNTSFKWDKPSENDWYFNKQNNKLYYYSSVAGSWVNITRPDTFSAYGDPNETLTLSINQSISGEGMYIDLNPVTSGTHSGKHKTYALYNSIEHHEGHFPWRDPEETRKIYKWEQRTEYVRYISDSDPQNNIPVNNDLYLDEETGAVWKYRSTQNDWISYGVTLTKKTVNLQSSIEQNAEGISMTADASTTNLYYVDYRHWNDSDITNWDFRGKIRYSAYGNPSTAIKKIHPKENDYYVNLTAASSGTHKGACRLWKYTSGAWASQDVYFKTMENRSKSQLDVFSESITGTVTNIKAGNSTSFSFELTSTAFTLKSNSTQVFKCTSNGISVGSGNAFTVDTSGNVNISGDLISSGSIDAANVTIKNLNADKITAGSLVIGGMTYNAETKQTSGTINDSQVKTSTVYNKLTEKEGTGHKISCSALDVGVAGSGLIRCGELQVYDGQYQAYRKCYPGTITYMNGSGVVETANVMRWVNA